MKATGIIRRVDDLGRVVIPREIRRTLHIKEGDPLEIYTDREDRLILKKYSPIGELGTFAKEYAEAMTQTTDHIVCITDRDQVIAAAGSARKDYIGKTISKELEEIINGRITTKHFVKVTDEESEELYPHVVCCPILGEGDINAIGSVILLNKDDKVRMGETEWALARCAANFIGKQV